ncbi:MAG: glutamine--fructose-6-phosphate transaminase (isomerizing) [Pseudomonadales bacterium]|nr:glutamine--fructose-6-phosphate transaminase (isomerizing) [Pseudomonadales bacterium]
MCGIVGAVGRRSVAAILLEGLRRLEYRGYDSAGIAVLNESNALERCRQVGKVQGLVDRIKSEPIDGHIGIAHTRWATHGQPAEVNAHPHASKGRVSIVHNGIIENFQALREELIGLGYEFESATDSETIAHLIDVELTGGEDLLDAVRNTIKRLDGAYALGVISTDDPDRIIAARAGSPLVVGKGIGENFIASDVLALKPVTDRFIFLEEGDLVEIRRESISVWNIDDRSVIRSDVRVEIGHDNVDKGNYRHHMQKEIFEQPKVLGDTFEGRLGRARILEQAFGVAAPSIFDRVETVTIVACGTSYYAASVARYWIEELAGVPCQVEIASEFRYRKLAVTNNSLFVTITQSGETADTLAALRIAKDIGYFATLTICNVPTSSTVRESDLALMIQAGTEVGVASTKAFTAQLADLMMLSLLLARRHGLSPEDESAIVKDLHKLAGVFEQTLGLDRQIRLMSERFIDKEHALFLGRGTMFPIAMEGALKLKEISYIHAEGYPAGELKHGPLALVDDDMPVIAVAPNDALLEKLHSNLQEVRARGGELFVFASQESRFSEEPGVTVIHVPEVSPLLAPLVYVVPLQLLAYHVAVLKGTDVDQPRNLAKSVTVE